uniref:Uncharacterized protein n=1 Tax=Trypanosoma congolense (strain IL3000) TaxID=1068625 RepID=G0UP75_TRYCI|nr:conserved hypothetical protein [Trypanosoma congolense IL3000]
MEGQTISVHYQRMQDWLQDRQSVLGKRYKKEYSRLLELAPKLLQLVKYDIPAQQRQQNKLSSAVEISHKAIEDANMNVQKFEERWAKMVENYNLQGDRGLDLEGDFEAAVDTRIACGVTALTKALREFGGSSDFLTFRTAYNDVLSTYSCGMFNGDVFARHFPWLDRTFAERTYSLETEAQQVRDEVTESGECDDVAAQTIDWGDAGNTGPIDTGAVVEIKWSADDECSGIAGSNCVDDEDDQLPAVMEGIFMINMGDPAHRKHVLAELQAMRCFASERLDAGDDSLAKCKKSIDCFREKLTTSTDAFFARMYRSATSRTTFIDEFQRLRRAVTTAATRRASSEARLQQVLGELREIEPQLNSMVNVARAIRDECVSELSKMFPEQQVVIVGDINKFL